MEIEKFIVSNQVWNKLEKYRACSLDRDKLSRIDRGYYSNTGNRGKFVEDLCELYLKAYDFEVVKLPCRRMQKVKGDFLVTNTLCKTKFVECKSSHVWQGIDKVALDYELYKKYTLEPYIPMDSDGFSNKGYLHYCEADILFCVNFISSKIYIVLDFQKLKRELLEMIAQYSDTEIKELSGIEGSMKCDSNKVSKIYNVDFKELHKLGVDVLEYDIIKECDIMENEQEKNTPSDQTESIS